MRKIMEKLLSVVYNVTHIYSRSEVVVLHSLVVQLQYDRKKEHYLSIKKYGFKVKSIPVNLITIVEWHSE